VLSFANDKKKIIQTSFFILHSKFSLEVYMKIRFLEAGQIVSTHGLKGDVRVMPWCDSADFLLQFNKLYFDKGKNFKMVEASSVHKSLVLLKFEGIDDINSAIKLMKSIIYIDRELVKLDEGSYFEQDLIGIEVKDADIGLLYGTLKEVSRTGRNDVYTIKRSDGSEVLIPAIKDVVKSIDIDKELMLISPLKGLFDDED
jgi:16S rRNA processing protein RimM